MLETLPSLAKEVLGESLTHAATMLPILFAAFLIVEVASHRAESGWLRTGMSHPSLGPIVAAGLGLVPQCGFSVATTSLYLEGFLPTGSLLASYIATSDEAIPILLSNPATLRWVLPLLATKLVWGAVAGIAVNLGSRRKGATPRRPLFTGGEAREPSPHGCAHGRTCVGTKGTYREFVPHALSRAVRIAAMVFVLSSLFNLAGHLLGDRLAVAASGGGIIRPLAASFLGLIPTCATSVVLAEGFSSGLVSFPALVSGLTANAGMGLLVLIKESKDRPRTIGVVALLVLSAFISGTLASLLVPA